MELAHPRAATTDNGQLAAQVKLVSSLELAVVAAIPLRSPRSDLVVLLDNDGLSTAAFCELASAAGARRGARRLYVQAESFDADDEPGLGVEGDHRGELHETLSAQKAVLRRDVEGFNSGHPPGHPRPGWQVIGSAFLAWARFVGELYARTATGACDRHLRTFMHITHEDTGGRRADNVLLTRTLRSARTTSGGVTL